MRSSFFEWYFGMGNRGESLFKEFEIERKKLAAIDDFFEALCNDQISKHPQQKKAVVEIFKNLARLFRQLIESIEQEREMLIALIQTSQDQYNYLSDIEKIARELSAELQTISQIEQEVGVNEYIGFVERTSDLRDSVHEKIRLIGKLINDFKAQSKNSLEWMYDKRQNNSINIVFFRSCVAELGGSIEYSMGKGGHFGVVFKTFRFVCANSNSTNNAITGNTLKGALLRALERTSLPFDIKYLFCFFFHNDKDYHKLFVRKYGDYFSLR